MKGFVEDVEALSVENLHFRRVLYTAKNCQLVLMSLKPTEEIGMEVHKLDQFFRVEEGSGEAILDGVRRPISAGFAIVVPAGANHNIVNTGAMACTPIAMVIVRTAGSPSGIAATVRPTTAMNRSGKL